jgi:hypothetical protein
VQVTVPLSPQNRPVVLSMSVSRHVVLQLPPVLPEKNAQSGSLPQVE